MGILSVLFRLIICFWLFGILPLHGFKNFLWFCIMVWICFLSVSLVFRLQLGFYVFVFSVFLLNTHSLICSFLQICLIFPLRYSAKVNSYSAYLFSFLLFQWFLGFAIRGPFVAMLLSPGSLPRSKAS